MKLKDVVRGVGEMPTFAEGENEPCVYNLGYNSLARAEVEIDIVALEQALRKNLDTFPVDANWTMLRDRGIDYQNLIRRSINAIAIKRGKIISLKGKEER